MTEKGPDGFFEYKITDEKTFMDLGFASNWGFIDLTKGFIESFLDVYFNGVDGIFKVGTAASELLENAVKYSDERGVRTTVVNDDVTGHVVLTVSNYSDDKNAKKLISMLDEMNSSDSLDYYVKRMRASVADKTQTSGLGLARLYHETNAILSASYDKALRLVQVKAIISVV
jgi:hypothetical protein